MSGTGGGDVAGCPVASSRDQDDALVDPGEGERHETGLACAARCGHPDVILGRQLLQGVHLALEEVSGLAHRANSKMMATSVRHRARCTTFGLIEICNSVFGQAPDRQPSAERP